MKIEKIEEHSFDMDLLPPGSRVLDVGCRGFSMARELSRRGILVTTIDPDVNVREPNPAIPGNTHMTCALIGGVDMEIRYCSFGNGTGNFTSNNSSIPVPGDSHVYTVDCFNIESLSSVLGIGVWDAVKLDCEGSEYDILMKWPGPIARQISVEFHDHVPGANPGGEECYKELFKHLGQWYSVVQHQSFQQHCPPMTSYWDTLLVLK